MPPSPTSTCSLLPALSIPAPPIGAATAPVQGRRGIRARRHAALHAAVQPHGTSGAVHAVRPHPRATAGRPAAGRAAARHRRGCCSTRSPSSSRSPTHDRAVLPPLGAAAGRGQPERSRRPPVRVGPRLAVPPDVASVAHLATEAGVGGESPSAGAADPRDAIRTLGGRRDARHRRVLHAGADARLHADTRARSSARGRRGRHAHASPARCQTPHPENNTVYARCFPAKPRAQIRAGAAPPRRAVVVLPQWNSDAERPRRPVQAAARSCGISSLRHQPARITTRACRRSSTRADYIVASNVVRTLQVCRQAVLDARRAIVVARDQGYDRIGMLGTSLGSCLAMLTDGARAAGARRRRSTTCRRTSATSCGAGSPPSTCAQGLDGPRRPRAAARAVAAHQPVRPIWIACAGSTRCSSTRSYDLTFPVDLSRMLVKDVPSGGIRPRRGDAALRPLQHGRGAVQVPGRLLPDPGTSWRGTCRCVPPELQNAQNLRTS